MNRSNVQLLLCGALTTEEFLVQCIVLSVAPLVGFVDAHAADASARPGAVSSALVVADATLLSRLGATAVAFWKQDQISSGPS